MKKINFLLPILIWLSVTNLVSQQSRVGIVAFYNVENLYDTIDTKGINDTEFTPKGPKKWNSERYWEKIDRLSEVISKFGHHENIPGAAIVGLSEVENREVVEDLVKSRRISHLNYKIVHFDSPDRRGVDVALLYQQRYFTVTNAKAVPLIVYDPKTDNRIYTRDQLVVSGIFDGEPMHFIVNHWPARRGSGPPNGWMRNEAAKLCRSLVDSIIQIEPNAKIIIMGDLNDDPTDESLRIHLNTGDDKNRLKPDQLFNTMGNLFKNGIGSLAYRDKWNMFDQIIVTQTLIDNEQKGYKYHSSRVFNDLFLQEREGRFKGYPKRSFVGNTYKGGYSDHFPVYIVLIKN
ncbi:MAG: endonuclease/exonuclease/phosphatase family protein [Marinilabiliaceae bacterium]|nr:endonuclease/exonuclease/phosphatase family protein [Marinilabiliaceae bacterium]